MTVGMLKKVANGVLAILPCSRTSYPFEHRCPLRLPLLMKELSHMQACFHSLKMKKRWGL